MNTREQAIRRNIADYRKEVEIYDNLLEYAHKYNIFGDIEYYGELRRFTLRKIERAEQELQEFRTA